MVVWAELGFFKLKFSRRKCGRRGNELIPNERILDGD